MFEEKANQYCHEEGNNENNAIITAFASIRTSKGKRIPITTWRKAFEGFASAKPPTVKGKDSLPGWCPATFRDDVRRKSNVEQVSALVLDFDDGRTTPAEALALWKGILACTYTSWSHTPEKPRFRLIVVLSRPVCAEEYSIIWADAAEALKDAGQEIDVACKDPSRLWYVPCRRDEHFGVVIQDGAPLDVETILSEHEPSPAGAFEPIEAFEAPPSYGASALFQESEAVSTAPEGQRNAQLNRSAFSLGQLVAGGMLDEDTVTRTLVDAAVGSGLPLEEATRTISSGMRAGARQPRILSTTTLPKVDSTPWGLPEPLAEDVTVPESPWRSCLPSWLRDWVEAEAIATQTPTDLAAMLALTALATCCQSRWLVQVKPGWKEQLCLMVAVILPPGSRKSAVFEAATAPLYSWEAEQREQIKDGLAAAQITVAIAERRLKEANAQASSATDEDAIQEALAAAKELAEAKDAIPVVPRLVTSDATQEAVARLLEQQGGCISVMDAEGCGPVAIMLGRYSSGGPAVDVYLRGHAGDALRVDRVQREPISIDRPRVTMGVTVQPTVVEQLGERRELRGLGLLARILWSHPVSTVGNRDVDPPSMPPTVENRYHEAIHALLGHDRPADEPEIIELSPEAWDALRTFMGDLEPRLGQGGDLAGVADWASKLAGAMARIAGLLHIAAHRGDGGRPISAATMKAAIQIGRYLLAHAQKVLGQMGASDPTLVDARALLAYVRKGKFSEISKRDLHQAVRKGHEGRFRKAEDLDEPLALLVDRGWIRLREHRAGKGKGRVSTIIDVNPNEAPRPQKAQKPQKVDDQQAEPPAAVAIEPSEAIEAKPIIEGSDAPTAPTTIDPDMERYMPPPGLDLPPDEHMQYILSRI